MSKFKPDAVVERLDGGRIELRFRRHVGADGSLSWVRRMMTPTGTVEEVWHEVYDCAGAIIHRHRLVPLSGGIVHDN